VPSEIQPLETRAAGTGINTFVNFIFTFLIGQCFLSILCAMKWGTFLFFCWICHPDDHLCHRGCPRDQGVPIEELSEVIVNRHWLWSRVVAGASREEAVSGIGCANTLCQAGRLCAWLQKAISALLQAEHYEWCTAHQQS